jgi:hypothetical protein
MFQYFTHPCSINRLPCSEQRIRYALKIHWVIGVQWKVVNAVTWSLFHFRDLPDHSKGRGLEIREAESRKATSNLVFPWKWTQRAGLVCRYLVWSQGKE